jgi:hypothetical protein
MKNFISIFFVLLIITLLHSCGKDNYNRNYRMDEDGLIYKYGTNELYTGLVTDTSDVIITFEVVGGIKHGAFITFYTNGNYEKYGMVENDVNIGTWSYFYPDGQLESTGSFKNNKPEGEWVSYYPNGKIKAKGEYIEGEQHGRWKFYDEEGELINVYIFGNGVFLEKLINS